MIKYPRLYERDKFTKIIYPVNVSITQTLVPLSTATISLPKGEGLPARSYVELFTPYGSAGMFRVRSPHDSYGMESTTAELEHMISEVGDYVVKEEISEMMAADAAVKRAFSHYKGGRWKLGSVAALGTAKIAFEAKYDRVLDVILSVLQQKPDCMMTFDFSTKPWTVSIVKKGTTVSAEGRLSRNVESATVSYDDSELCTRVWYQVFASDKTATWKSKDANVSKYGVVEGTVRTSADMSDAEITATVNAFLNDHKDPRVSVNIQAVELCQITGESMDKLEVGKLYRLALPDYGLTMQDNITSITWEDVYGSPTSVTVNLGDEEDTVVTFLHNLDAKGAGGGGGGGAKNEKDKEWSEYIVEWEKGKESIYGLVSKQDVFGNILEQAGLELNSQGLLVYAHTTNGLYHQFNVLNNSLTSKITNLANHTETLIEQLEDEINLKVDKDGIITAINVAPGTVTINAKKLDIKGIVSGLKSENLDVGDINCEGRIDVDQDIDAGGTVSGLAGSFTEVICGTGGLQVGSDHATWKTAQIEQYTLSGTARYYAYFNNITHEYMGSTLGKIVTDTSTKTIHYLGRS